MNFREFGDFYLIFYWFSIDFLLKNQVKSSKSRKFIKFSRVDRKKAVSRSSDGVRRSSWAQTLSELTLWVDRMRSGYLGRLLEDARQKSIFFHYLGKSSHQLSEDAFKWKSRKFRAPAARYFFFSFSRFSGRIPKVVPFVQLLSTYVRNLHVFQNLFCPLKWMST